VPQKLQIRKPLPTDVPGPRTSHTPTTSPSRGLAFESNATRNEGEPGFRSSSDKLSNLLNELHHLDLSGEVVIDGRRPLYGGCADVFKGYLVVENKPVAVKRLRIYPGSNNDVSKNILKEIYVWSKLSHTNVLPLLGYVIEQNYPSLVSEWMVKGSLRSYMNMLSTARLFVMAIGIARGLRYLHVKGVIHADLKTDNVLISSSGDPLLADFGISRLASSSTIGFTTDSVRGSTRWMACELLVISENEDDGPPRHNEKTDVWSYGMTLLELISGNVP